MLRVLILLFLILANTDVLATPAITLKDIAGKPHHLPDYKGKWLIVNYWATWCPPCLEEVPDLIALYDKRKNKDVMVIGIVFEYQTSQEVEKYVDDMLISYPIVLGNQNIAHQIGAADVLPTTYIYNPQGQLIKVWHGLITKTQLDNLMKSP